MSRGVLTAKIESGETLSVQEVAAICNEAISIMRAEPNLLRLSAPVTIVGDIHGQFFDLKKMFEVLGDAERTFLFLGDYVDRGCNSLETMLYLLLLKLERPARVFLLRGNHECRKTSFVYGLLEECERKYGTSIVWTILCNVFDHLPLAATINGRILALHGGIGPSLRELSDLFPLDRVDEIPLKGIVSEIMWSDPKDPPEGVSQEEAGEGFVPNPRGAGFLFGEKELLHFLRRNNLEALLRSHQLVNEGYREIYGGALVTIWSAPNYCYRCGNKACVLVLDKNLNRTYVEIPQADVQKPPVLDLPVYFL